MIRTVLALMALFCMVGGAFAQQIPSAYRGDGGGAVSPYEFKKALREADVVILGERHDNPAHHAAQAAIVETLAGDGGVAALVFEMLPPELERAANLHRTGLKDLETLGEMLQWEKRGWPSWDLYAPIFAAAPKAPIYGGAIERKDLMNFAFAPQTWPYAEAFQLTVALPPAEQSQREREQIEAHCNKIPSEAAPGMVMAQRLRDAAFAQAVLRAHEANNTGVIVLIAGSGHARKDRAVPAALSLVAPDLKVASIALTEGEDITSFAPYDYILPTQAHDRGDPCEAFNK